MKLGIRAIRYIPVSQVGDYGALPAGSSVRLASFITGSLSPLPVTVESADISENWHYDENGRYSEFTLTAPVRASKEDYRDAVRQLAGRKAIFTVELVNGKTYIIGSTDFVPTFTFADSISGISTSEFSINIALRSLHGVFLLSQ